MRVMTTIVRPTLRESVQAAVAAEEMGYDGILSMENRHDPFLPLAAAAVGTERVELSPSVAIAFPRSPMVTAYIAHDLQMSSNGRFVLGLGTQVRGHNERRFSVPWTAPAPRLAEYIESLRAIWQSWNHDEPLDFRGEHYRFNLMPPNFTPAASPFRPVPITVAAVGAAMLRLAGHHGDGVRLHSFCTRRYVENVVIPEITKGLERGSRPRKHFEISGGGFLATGPDAESVAEMVEVVRQRVAFYGSTRAYFPVLAQHGLEDLGEKLRRMSLDGKWDDMPREVPDNVVGLFAAVGTHEHITNAIETRFGGLADALPDATKPGGAATLIPDLIHDIQRIPCKFSGFAE